MKKACSFTGSSLPPLAALVTRHVALNCLPLVRDELEFSPLANCAQVCLHVNPCEEAWTMDFDGNGYRMHYRLFGDPAGEPLLWLHGWSGTGEDWKYIFKNPPTGFRLIGPDARGNGASSGFEGTHSFRQSARDTFALLDHLGVRRVKAIGLSGGELRFSIWPSSSPSASTR